VVQIVRHCPEIARTVISVVSGFIISGPVADIGNSGAVNLLFPVSKIHEIAAVAVVIHLVAGAHVKAIILLLSAVIFDYDSTTAGQPFVANPVRTHLDKGVGITGTPAADEIAG
jgi:hypothetical protein